MTQPRDFQRQKCYDWEKEFFRFETNRISLSEIKNISNQACKVFKCKAVSVGDGRGRTNPCYKPWRHQICMPMWGRYKWITLHESAHGIVGYKLQKKEQRTYASHGAMFMGVYAVLISKFYGFVLDDILRSLDAWEIKFYVDDEMKTLSSKLIDIPLVA